MKYLIIIILGFTVKLSAQNKLSFQLLDLEEQVFLAKNDSAKNELIYQKFDLLIDSLQELPSIFEEMKRIRYSLLKDSCDQRDFLWNASLVSYQMKEFEYAHFYIKEYYSITRDNNLEEAFLKSLIFAKTDTASFIGTLPVLQEEDSVFSCLSCLQTLAEFELKHRKLYQISSVIIPGSGTIAAGKVVLGSASLLFHAGTIYGIVELVKNQMYFNAAAIGISLVPRFYAGNLVLTDKSIQQLEDKKRGKLSVKCENELRQVFDQYPLLYH